MHIAAAEKLGGNPDFGLFTTFKRPLRIHHSVPIICGVEGSLGGIHMCIRVESEQKKSTLFWSDYTLMHICIPPRLPSTPHMIGTEWWIGNGRLKYFFFKSDYILKRIR